LSKTIVKDLKVLAKTNFLSLYNADYINKGGKEKTWTIATRKSKEALEEQFFQGKEDKMDAVVILAYHKEEKKLVAIRQFRVPLNNYVYELPAGLIDNNDDIISTVERELKEETGLKLEEVIENKIGNKLYLSPGMTDESVALVYCTCSGKISTENLEEDEDIETILLSKEDAIKILNSNERCDIKFFMALQSFIINGEEIFKWFKKISKIIIKLTIM